MNLVAYQSKTDKMVCLLSTMHRGAETQVDGKKKPDSVLYYNANKCRVDMLDSMCRQLSTKAPTRHWTMATFCNLLDMAIVNAWIIYQQKLSTKITRRQFMLTLSQQLTEEAVSCCNSAKPDVLVPEPAAPLPNHVTCQVKTRCNRNRMVLTCTKCKLPVCRQCMATICSKFAT